MNIKAVRIVLPLAALLLAAPAMADLIFSEDFNSYADGLLLPQAAAKWEYNWAGANSGWVSGGVMLQGNGTLGWNEPDVNCFFPNIFSVANTARIEFDMRASNAETTVWIGPGSRDGSGGTSMNYSQSVGGQWGPYANPFNNFTAYHDGAYDYGHQENPVPGMLMADFHHIVIDFTNTAGVITLATTWDGNAFAPLTSTPTYLNLSVTDPRGISSIEFMSADWGGYPAIAAIDNIKVYSGSIPSGWDFLPGDFNKDGEVGPEDFGILKDNFGIDGLPSGNHESWTLGDANDDGEIGPEDFGLLKDNFGLDGGPTGTYPLSNVPEPTTLALLALGGLFAARKNRR
ncbi:MAG: PEP-CTERM sorting domain-containing protein [Planctomycetota bacterium]|nr:PEP-CTERM sorting domain-containing protein [Planctomycetota bacterium]